MGLKIPASTFSLCFVLFLFFQWPMPLPFSLLYLCLQQCCSVFVPGPHTNDDVGPNAHPTAFPSYTCLAPGLSHSYSGAGLQPRTGGCEMTAWVLSSWRADWHGDSPGPLLRSGKSMGQDRWQPLPGRDNNTATSPLYLYSYHDS